MTEGNCIISDVYWRDAVDPLADFGARLSIFYSDFKSSSKIPDVDSQLLQSAISELEKAVNELAVDKIDFNNRLRKDSC